MDFTFSVTALVLALGVYFWTHRLRKQVTALLGVVEIQLEAHKHLLAQQNQMQERAMRLQAQVEVLQGWRDVLRSRGVGV